MNDICTEKKDKTLLHDHEQLAPSRECLESEKGVFI